MRRLAVVIVLREGRNIVIGLYLTFLSFWFAKLMKICSIVACFTEYWDMPSFCLFLSNSAKIFENFVSEGILMKNLNPFFSRYAPSENICLSTDSEAVGKGSGCEFLWMSSSLLAGDNRTGDTEFIGWSSPCEGINLETGEFDEFEIVEFIFWKTSSDSLTENNRSVDNPKTPWKLNFCPGFILISSGFGSSILISTSNPLPYLFFSLCTGPMHSMFPSTNTASFEERVSASSTEFVLSITEHCLLDRKCWVMASQSVALV